MGTKAMRRNLRQSIFKSLGRYIAIVMIIALGCCLFIGLLVTRKDMLATGEVYIAESQMYDFRMISTYGWDDDQVAKAARLEGVANAEGVFYQDLIASRKGESGVYRFYNIPDTINQVLLRGGRMPRNSEECLADGYLAGRSILGKKIVLSEENDPDSLENMTHRSYTVVGYVASPLYMDPNRGTTTVGSGSLDGYFYIPRDGFCADYYTQIDLTLADKAPIYSDAYNDRLEAMTDIMQDWTEQLGQERYEAVRLDAEQQYQEGYQEYLDGLQEYNDGKAEFESELEKARKELEDGQATIDENRKKLESGEAQIRAARATLYANEQDLIAGEAELKRQEAAAREALPQLQDGIMQLENARLQILTSLSPMTPSGIGPMISTIDATIRLIESGYAPYLESQYDTLVTRRNELQTALDYYNTINSQLTEVNAQYETVRKALSIDIPAGYQAIEAGRLQIQQGRILLDQQEQELKKGAEELEKGQAELDQGWVDYEAGKLEGEQELQDAWQKLEEGRLELQDAREEIDSMEPVEVYLLDRNTNVGYNSLNSSANILAGVSRILPVFFLLVAALVCITTMTRMIDEERTQIGTLKALGYSSGSIVSKYLIYAGSATVLGSILGSVAGCTVIPNVLWVAFGAMLYLQPNVVLTVDWPLCLAVGGVCTALMLLVTWYCCRRALQENPAELIRPKAPDPGKKLLLEYLPFWKHISFLNKVTIRNIFRYRQRLAMMLVGIGGCTALLVTGFGLRNSLVGVVDYQYDQITLQHLEVYLDGHQEEAVREEFVDALGSKAEDILFLHQSSVTLQSDNGVAELSMLCAGEDLTRLVKLVNDGQGVSMPGKGEALLSIGVAQNNGIRPGDTVTIRDADMRTITVTVSGIFENHINNFVIITPETYQEQLMVPVDVQMAYVRAGAGEDHYLLAAEITKMDNVLNVMVSADFVSMLTELMKALDMLVWVIVICAGLLAAIVLYNLTNINITERIREIATIKVLGFNAAETAAYVFKENVTLTVAGSLLGLWLGELLLWFVLLQVKVDLIWFRTIIQPSSYIISLALTMLCALAVNFLFYFKLDKINMAEALKSVE